MYLSDTIIVNSLKVCLYSKVYDKNKLRKFRNISFHELFLCWKLGLFAASDRDANYNF